MQKYTYLFLPFVHAYSCLIPIRNKFKCICVYYNSSFTHLLVLTLISNITMCIWLPLNSFSVHLSGLRLIRNLRNAYGHLLAIHFVHLLGIKVSRNKFQLLVIFSDKVNGRGREGSWAKMSATMVGWRRKILKLHWLKRHKKVPKKRNLDPKINNSQLHIWSLFCSFRFSSRKSRSQEKLAEKVTHFTIQFHSKKPFSHFPNFDSLNIVKMILPKQKPYSLCKFCIKHDSGLCQKKHLHCTISRRPRTGFSKHLEMKCLDILVNLFKKIFVPEE